MILDPVLPVWLLAVLTVVLGGFAIWMLVRARTRLRRLGWVLRLAAVLLLLVIALRPAIPGEVTAPRASGVLEVFFVLDTTSSMAAEDVETRNAPSEGDLPATRLSAAQADIAAITQALPGARFSLTTFDAVAVQRVPLTSDAAALASAASVLTTEISGFSRGSSIGEPVALMTEVLAGAAAANPDSRRVLYYLGDGEQTREGEPESFEPLLPYVSQGAVLGYGTADGGVMRFFDGYAADDDPSEPLYIRDPATGDDAVSSIDEANLTSVADTLGLEYLHRGGADDPAGIEQAVAGIDVGEGNSRGGSIVGPVEFYWILALPLALIALVEVLAAGIVVAGTLPSRRRPAEQGRNDV